MIGVRAFAALSVLAFAAAVGGSSLSAQGTKAAPPAAPAAKAPAAPAQASAAKAPAAAQTPTEVYMAYRAAFDKATKSDDIKPFQAKSVRAEMDAQKPKEREDFFKMVKDMGAMKTVKVAKETVTGNNATLMVDAVNPGNVKMACEVKMVKEDGAWKIAAENWSAK